MSTYSFTHLPDHVLAREVDSHVIHNRTDTAVALAKVAEFDARRLYRPAAFASTYQYCVGKLRMDPGEAFRWIRVARVGARFPSVFPALGEGRLSRSTVLLLAPYLISHTAGDLLTAAENKSVRAVKRLLAQRFPQPDVPTEIRPIVARSAAMVVAPEPVVPFTSTIDAPKTEPLTPESVVPCPAPSPAIRTEPLGPPARVEPLSSDRNALQVTIDDETVELIDRVKALLGHSLPSGDVAQVLKRALQCLEADLARRKFAKVDSPRAGSGACETRVIPADVRRAVESRDGGRCTFTSAEGKRCDETLRLEFDHQVPVARGGRTTIENVRLLCRAHNQYEASRVYGAGFMQQKRDEARMRAAQKRARANGSAPTHLSRTISNPSSTGWR